MVGHEGVGKTTYVSSMYREMATNGVGGFWVKAQSDAEHRRLLAAAEGVARARYPPPSEQRSTYGLTLRHGGNSLIEFTWSDYRGGALREARTAQSAELVEDAMTADAVLIFIEARDLGSRPIGRARIRDLTNIALQVIDGRELLVPIVLVITKSDLIDELSLTPLESFIGAVKDHERVCATIAPVVCGPRPVGILLPVMFSLYFGLLTRAANLHANVLASANAAEALERKRSGADWLVSRFKGEPTYGELAALMQQQAVREYESLEPLIRPVQDLEFMLGDIDVY